MHVNRRFLLITTTVVLLHAAALWALQSGLLRRAPDAIVPAVVVAELLEPAAAQAVPAPAKPQARSPAPNLPTRPAPLSVPMPTAAQAPAPAPVATPQPLAAPAVAPLPHATAAAQAAVAPAAPGAAAGAAGPSAPPSAGSGTSAGAVQAAAKVELPSSDADYLKNPKPTYPPLSRRQHEQGQVLVRVLIGVEGTAQKAEIHKSSGFERLDQAALATVLKWRYLPGKRAGVPEAMWFNVPINFVLE